MSDPLESLNPESNPAQPSRRGADRLLRALNAPPPDRHTCNRIRVTFPEMAEAELRGERIAQLFPTETAHLDACDACALEYGELLDALLELERAVGVTPDMPAPMLPAHMLTALRIRRWVTTTAQQVLRKTLQDYGNVEVQLASWLEELAAAPLSVTPQVQQQMALAYGGENTEMPLIQATWFAAQTLAEQYTVDQLRVLQSSGALAAQVRQVAEGVARQLPRSQRRAFVETFVVQALADPEAIAALGRAD
jgi:hypothetical protein